MELELQDKVVCITGGSRGIGLATAQAFAAEGASVIICSRNAENLKTAAEQIGTATGKQIDSIQADVSQVEDIDRLIFHLAAGYGRLDILVNNAGTGIYKSFADITESELLEGMSINFFAQFRVTQRALSLLRRSAAGVVINVSGRTAIRGNFPPGSSCTGPAKAAEVRFSIDLATELAQWGIRVNCVIPGVVETADRFKLWEGQALKQVLSDRGAEGVRGRIKGFSAPWETRWGQPEEIANVILFLASARASYVNGAALVVDGGPHNKSYITELYARPTSMAKSG